MSLHSELRQGYYLICLLALMLASKCGNANIVQTLLEKGANKRLCGNDGQTAMSLAVLGPYLPVITLLVPELPEKFKNYDQFRDNFNLPHLQSVFSVFMPHR